VDELEAQLSNLVIFELPTFEDVEAFCERFRPQWSGWSLVEPDLWLFSVELCRSDDLSALLHGAQQLVAELGLWAIRFYLDGRAYVLEALPRPTEARRGRSSSPRRPMPRGGT
jgi:hypothetical protein